MKKKRPYNTCRLITIHKSEKLGGLTNVPTLLPNFLKSDQNPKKLFFSKDEEGKIKYEHTEQGGFVAVVVPRLYKNKDTVFYAHYVTPINDFQKK